MEFEISEVAGESDLGAVQKLFEEYAAWLEYEFCFDNIERELEELPGEYGPPDGCLLIAKVASESERDAQDTDGGPGAVAGCVALRRWEEEGTCEMKRLYVRPHFRVYGLGRRLAAAIIVEARRLGYKRMRLDTLPQRMALAIALYRSLGFRRIEKYRASPTEDALYMQLDL